MSALGDHLTELERRTPLGPQARLLWPRTPIGEEIQERIRERVGVSDREANNRRSRPWRIAALVAELRRRGLLEDSFTVLDVACGDALILLDLQSRFPSARCHGVDLNVGAFAVHSEATAAGIALHCIPIQALFAAATPEQWDIVMMLNTYRGWESADLTEEDRDLPERADDWLQTSARFVIVTAVERQLERWRDAGWGVSDLGPGEDASRLVCLSREMAPGGLRSFLIRRGLARAR